MYSDNYRLLNWKVQFSAAAAAKKKTKKKKKKTKEEEEEEETGSIISIYSEPHLNTNHMIYICQDSWDSEQL
jgi:hypothetical protein